MIQLSDAERATTLYHLGLALDEVEDAKATFAAFDEAERLASGSGDVWNGSPASGAPRCCRTLILTACLRRNASQLEEAIREFEELGDETGLATAWAKVAFLEFIPCLYDRAGRAAREAVDHARRSGDDRLFNDAFRYLLFSQMFRPHHAERGV